MTMAKGFRLAIIAAMIPIYMFGAVSNQAVKEYVQAIYLYDVNIRVFDAESGEPVSQLNVSGDGIGVWHSDDVARLPQSSAYSSFKQDGKIGSEVHLQGAAVKPIEVDVSSDGYQIQKVIVDRDSRGVIRVDLEKIKDGE